MEETRYGLRVEVPLDFEQAVARATEALKAQGFGVLTTIDVKQTLKEKLDRDFRNYSSWARATRHLPTGRFRGSSRSGSFFPAT